MAVLGVDPALGLSIFFCMHVSVGVFCDCVFACQCVFASVCVCVSDTCSRITGC